MKKFSIFIFSFLLLTFQAQSQKFGYIDSDVILKQLPEYQKAEKELEESSAKWQQEIEGMKKKIEALQTSFAAEEVLLSEEMRKERLDSIAEKDKAYRAYQKKIFGFQGLVFLKRQELMKPVQEKVYKAVEKVAKEKQLQIIFDRSADLVMIYTNPIHNYTDYVLEELGLGDAKDVTDNKK